MLQCNMRDGVCLKHARGATRELYLPGRFPTYGCAAAEQRPTPTQP